MGGAVSSRGHWLAPCAPGPGAAILAARAMARVIVSIALVTRFPDAEASVTVTASAPPDDQTGWEEAGCCALATIGTMTWRERAASERSVLAS